MRAFTDTQTLQTALNNFLELHDIVYIKDRFYDCELSCVHVEDRKLYFDVAFHLHTDTKVIVMTYAFSKDRHDTEISEWFAGNEFIFPS